MKLKIGNDKKWNKKVLFFIILVFLVAISLVLVASGNLSRLMGNSISAYHCVDDTWKLEGTMCSKTITEKAELFADINLDSKIDNSDLELLNYYIENNDKVDYTILSNIQLVLADINGDGDINNLDSKMLDYYIANPDKQSKDMVCEKGFNLNGNDCELEANIPALVDDNSVGASNNNIVSFGFADFYKTSVGTTDIYIEYDKSKKDYKLMDSKIVNILIEEIQKLKNENEAYLAASNVFLLSEETYDIYDPENKSAGFYSGQEKNIYLSDTTNIDYFKASIKHEFGHSIDFMNDFMTEKGGITSQNYKNQSFEYYLKNYKNGTDGFNCDGEKCLRDYAYTTTAEFWAELFSQGAYTPPLLINNDLIEFRNSMLQVYNKIYNDNKDKFFQIKSRYRDIYIINYDGAGGYGKLKPQVATAYNIPIAIRNNVFSRDNFVFDGWKVENSDGTWLCYTNDSKTNKAWKDESYCKQYGYVRYNDGENVTALARPDRYITLHVIWKEVTNEQTSLINYVVVNSDNTHETIATQNVPVGSNSLKSYSYKNDLKFKGWYAKRSDGYGYCYVDSDKNNVSWVNQNTCNLYDYKLLIDQQEFYNDNTNYSYTMEAQFDYYVINYVIKNSINTYNTIATQKASFGSTSLIAYNGKDKSDFIGWYAKRSDGAGYCYTNYDKDKADWVEPHACNKYGYVLMLDQQDFWHNDRTYKEITLEAQFNNYELEIKFDGNGATAGRMYSKKIDSSNCEYYALWTNYFKQDYGFLGWYAKRVDGLEFCNSSSDPNAPGIWADKNTCNRYGHKLIRDYERINLCNINANVTFVAQWTKNYEVYFYPNGGTGKMDLQSILYGAERELNPNTFKNGSFSFIGWNAQLFTGIEFRWLCTTSKGSNKYEWVTEDKCVQKKLFKNKEKVKNIVEPGDFVAMYAQWDYKNTINFDGNGATSGNMTSINYSVYEKCSSNSLPENGFKNTDYGFLGWYADTVDGRGYCYTSYAKNDADWSDKDTCSRFGHKLINNRSSYNRTGICNLNSNVTLKAQWTKSYILKFNKNHTDNVNDNDVTGTMSDEYMIYGTPKSISPNSFKTSKKNYGFAGWHAKRDDGKWYCYTDSSKTKHNWSDKSVCEKNGYYLYKDELVVTNTAEPGGSTTLYAQWTNEYTLKFDGNGATKGSMSNEKMIYGTSKGITKNGFSKDGYVFIGWYAKRADGKWYCYTSPSKTSHKWLDKNACDNNGYYLYTDGFVVTNTAEPGSFTTLYAQWSEPTFTILFDKHHSDTAGAGGVMNPQRIEYNGKHVALRENKYTRSGYAFLGWYAKRDDGTWYCYTSDSSKNAKWASKSKCVKFFLYKDKLPVNNTGLPGKTVTMYAQWTNKFTLKFDGNGATRGSMKDQEITYGVSTPITHVGFEKDGYKFLGWNAKRDDGKGYCYTNSAKTKKAWSSVETCRRFGYYLYKDQLKVKDTANIGGYTTMVAIWTNKFTLKFDANGGTGTMKDQEIVYGTPTSIYPNEFKKEGYKFIGWYAKRDDGKGYCYAQGASKASWVDQGHCDSFGKYYLYKDELKVKDTANIGGYTKMVAQWEKIVCTTQYSCDNGTLLGDGPDSYCLIDYGKATKYLVRTYCPSGMQKLDETKCSYKTYTYIPGTKIYECPKGGKASGNTCYLDTKKEYGYKCTNGYNLNGHCYGRANTKKTQKCS